MRSRSRHGAADGAGAGNPPLGCCHARRAVTRPAAAGSARLALRRLHSASTFPPNRTLAHCPASSSPTGTPPRVQSPSLRRPLAMKAAAALALLALLLGAASVEVGGVLGRGAPPRQGSREGARPPPPPAAAVGPYSPPTRRYIKSRAPARFRSLPCSLPPALNCPFPLRPHLAGGDPTPAAPSCPPTCPSTPAAPARRQCALARVLAARIAPPPATKTAARAPA